MSEYVPLPHVDAGTNYLVMNALATTVENEVERVFDFTVAEDVVTNFLKGSPAILGYDMEKGPWNHRGATRIVHAEGDAHWRETIVEFQRPYLFHYQLHEFRGGKLEGFVDHAIAQFIMQPYGPRTMVKFYYAFRPVDPARIGELHGFMQETWHPWQQSYLDAMKGAIDKDPWSA